MTDQQAKRAEELKELRKKMKGGYAVAKRNAEARVQRYVYATGLFNTSIPFEPELAQQVRGKLLPKKPAVPKDCYEFGLDDRDRPCVVRRIGKTGKPEGERFMEEAGKSSSIRRIYLQAGKMIGAIARIGYDAGKVAEVLHLGDDNEVKLEEYKYDGDRICAIDVEWHAPKSMMQLSYQFDYDKSGGGEATAVRTDGKKSVAFKFSNPDAWSWPDESGGD